VGRYGRGHRAARRGDGMTRFVPVTACWICGGADLRPIHDAPFDLSIYRDQDPALAAYSGERVAIARCRACGFAQPDRLPALDRFFDRMYDQRWSADWIAAEHEAVYKDTIFADILHGLAARLPRERRRLLDVGAHAGRFMRLARNDGWDVEGLELNPQTAAFARRTAGGQVYQLNVHAFDPGERLFDAVTLTDVLEHIPEPVPVLSRLRSLLAPDGWVAVKVPNAPAQRFKEHARARLRRGYRETLADNLVHVNHFSPRSLRMALERAGFDAIRISAGAPELPPGGAAGRLLRRTAFVVTRTVPGAVNTPLAFNLQAFARRG
jgi:2-polyprenyl-3-methyl-5-hydroxy-6-metoxy-1,4-benzoquinol methylase